MHFLAGVVIDPDETDIETAVAKAMAPHKEWYGEDDYGGLWDWYQIGGRWTGVWSGYEPREDPANWATCWLCHGSGTRTDETALRLNDGKPMPCNGCEATGTALNWSAEYVRHDGDVQPVQALLDNTELQMPYVLIAPDAPLLERPNTDATTWNSRIREALLAYQSAAIVVVDYHC